MPPVACRIVGSCRVRLSAGWTQGMPIDQRRVASTKTLKPYSLGPFCNSKAIKLPNPPLGMVPWFGKSRCRIPFSVAGYASMMMAGPKRGRQKNTQVWAPWPEREISNATGTPRAWQDWMSARASFRQSASSKSTARDAAGDCHSPRSRNFRAWSQGF